MSRRLEVLLHGDLVGQLSELPDGGSEFRLTESYREKVPRPVLGQVFEDDLDKVHRSRRREQLPDFFANLIPEEGRLREAIEAAGGLEAGDEMAFLAFVGEDLPGAVVARPVGEGELGPVAARPESASTEGPVEASEGTPEEAPEGDDRLRFSLAGVQMKFSMLRREDTLTLPARDERGEWIVKFDSPTFRRLPENEYSMLEWARASGFEVPECHLHDRDDLEGFPARYALPDSRVLAVRRYDRTEEGRVHQEDFAQAVNLPPRRKYDQVTYEAMALLAGRFMGSEAVEEWVRRLVFTVAIGNSDAHLKNWSLVYPDGIRAAWSPLYDQVSTVAWGSTSRELSLKLAGVKDFGRIDLGAFQRLAERADLEADRVVEQVDRTLESMREAWGEIGGDLPLPEDHRKALHEHWSKVPLLRDPGLLD